MATFSKKDGPMLNGFMKSQNSLTKSELFFSNEEYLKMFLTATPDKELLTIFQCCRILLTDILKLEKSTWNFYNYPSVDTCKQCPKPTFILPKCHKIHKLMRDYSADGYHYLPASKMN